MPDTPKILDQAFEQDMTSNKAHKIIKDEKNLKEIELLLRKYYSFIKELF